MNLTTEQQTLVTAAAPVVVAVAGPGAGKTSTLAARFRYWRQLEPSGYVAIITFTNAAAAHLEAKIGGAQPGVFVGTLHAFALRFLSASRPRITLLDEEQADDLLKEAITECRAKTSVKALREILNKSRTATQPEKVVIMRYRAKLRADDAEDFDTLLLSFLERMESGTQIELAHLYVDEYQDSGTLDHAIYSAIQAHRKFYVGDVNQSIYGFRGGRLENLLELIDSPDTFTGFMEANYRCGGAICQAANNLISHNRKRGDNITASATGETGFVQAAVYETEGMEETWIANFGARLNGTTAVLVRYNADRERITKALTAAGVAVAQAPDADLPGDWKLAIAMLNLAANPDSQAHAYRFLQCRDGKQRAAAARIDAMANARPLKSWDRPTNLMEAMEVMKLSREMRGFIKSAWLAVSSPGGSWWEDAATMALWLQQEIAAPKPKTEGVEVLTIHKAKGLEWDNVIVSGLEEGTLPGSDVEESRRLLYVAVTRARRFVTVTSCEKRFDPFRKKVTERTLSRFVAELAKP